MKLQEMTLQQLKDAIAKAPDIAELYHPASKSYIRGAFSEGKTDYFSKWSSLEDYWIISSTDSKEFLNNSILLSDIRARIAELEPSPTKPTVECIDKLDPAKCRIVDPARPSYEH